VGDLSIEPIGTLENARATSLTSLFQCLVIAAAAADHSELIAKINSGTEGKTNISDHEESGAGRKFSLTKQERATNTTAS
jgi:hypothetical protein